MSRSENVKPSVKGKGIKKNLTIYQLIATRKAAYFGKLFENLNNRMFESNYFQLFHYFCVQVIILYVIKKTFDSITTFFLNSDSVKLLLRPHTVCVHCSQQKPIDCLKISLCYVTIDGCSSRGNMLLPAIHLL